MPLGREIAIGIDVGGTKIAIGAVAGDGTVLARQTLPMPSEGRRSLLLVRIWKVARALVQSIASGTRPSGVGVAVPELVDGEGEIRSASTVDWTTAEIVALLGELAPVRVEADVRAAALAEAALGAARGLSSVVYVSIGTGISSCLLKDGVPYGGARGFAHLVGSSCLAVRCPRCGDLFQHVLEAVASGPAIKSNYVARTGRRVERTEEVFQLAEASDEAARSIIEEATVTLGSFLGLLVNVYDPVALVVGGGLGSAGGRFWQDLVRSTRDHIWAPDARAVPIVRAALGSDAGFVGAGLIALRASGSRGEGEGRA